MVKDFGPEDLALKERLAPIFKQVEEAAAAQVCAPVEPLHRYIDHASSSPTLADLQDQRTKEYGRTITLPASDSKNDSQNDPIIVLASRGIFQQVQQVVVTVILQEKTSEGSQDHYPTVLVELMDKPFQYPQFTTNAMLWPPREDLSSQKGFSIISSNTTDAGLKLRSLLQERLDAAIAHHEDQSSEDFPKQQARDKILKILNRGQGGENGEKENLQDALTRMLNQGKGRLYTADLIKLSTPQLVSLSHLLEQSSLELGATIVELDQLHRELDLVIFERTTQLSGDTLNQDIQNLVDHYMQLLRGKQTGVNSIVEVLEKTLGTLSGGSRTMLALRLSFVQVLSRAYEMVFTKESRGKSIAYLANCLSEFDKLEVLNDSLKEFWENPEVIQGLKVPRSQTAELLMRAHHLRIMHDITTHRERIGAINALLALITQWIEDDEREGLINQLAWKVLGRAQVTILLGGQNLKVAQDFLETAKALGELLIEPDKSQFFREANRASQFIMDLQATAVDILELESTGDPPTSSRSRTVSTTAKLGSELSQTVDTAILDPLTLLVAGPAAISGPVSDVDLVRVSAWLKQFDDPEKLLQQLLSLEKSTLEFKQIHDINPVQHLRRIQRCHFLLCTFYWESLIIFNYKHIAVRPPHWAFFSAKSFIRNLYQAIEIQRLIREKLALTSGLASLLDQIEFLKLDKVSATAAQDRFLGALHLGSMFSRSGDSKVIAKVCWSIWSLCQISKAQSLASLLAVDQYFPEEVARSFPDRGNQELHRLIEAERELVLRIQDSKLEERVRIGARAKLHAIRREMQKEPSLERYLKLRRTEATDARGLCSMFGGISDIKDIVYVDYFACHDTYSISIARPKSNFWPIFRLTNVKKSDVVSWRTTYRQTADLRDPTALEELGLLSGLIAPLFEHTQAGDTLILCATGALHTIPLHAIMYDDVLLIERNPVVYCPSLSIMGQGIQRLRERAGFKAFNAAIFGDPTGDTGKGRELAATLGGTFGGLLHGQSSVDEIGKMFGTSAFVGQEVTKSSFQSISEDSTLIHYHGHASYDPPEILDRGLVLHDDNVLKAREIFSLRFSQAPLVTLIACASGEQSVQIQDEPLGIIPAFLYAGASSVVGTLWPILDVDGATFSRYFYECLYSSTGEDLSLDGAPIRNVARALQHAILGLRSQEGYKDALYNWGAYVISGSPFAKGYGEWKGKGKDVDDEDFKDSDLGKQAQDTFDFTIFNLFNDVEMTQSQDSFIVRRCY